jgi:hypothetical protein
MHTPTTGGLSSLRFLPWRSNTSPVTLPAAETQDFSDLHIPKARPSQNLQSLDYSESQKSTANTDQSNGDRNTSTAQPPQQGTHSEKMHLADQSEEFTLILPGEGNKIGVRCATFRRESLKALMVRGDPDAVFDRYYEGYSRCFTDPNEVERKSDLRELLEVGKGDWDISVITQDGAIVAGYHTKLAKLTSYDLGVFSVGDYLWTDKSVRRLGLGQKLYNQTMQFRKAQGAQGHFGEIRDVNLLPQTELVRDWKVGTTSKERIGFWKKQERMALDAPWIQPALSEGQKEIEFYMLTLSILDRSCPRIFPREAYLELWSKFYPRHKNSSEFEHLQQLTSNTSLIRLIPLDVPRTYIRAVRWPRQA